MSQKQETKRRSALAIMGNLIGLVKPLFPIMLAAILLGTLGYLCAIFLTILASQAVLFGLSANLVVTGFLAKIPTLSSIRSFRCSNAVLGSCPQ